MTHQDLEKLNPCPEGLDYAKQFSTLSEAWDECSKPSWMWWFLSRIGKISEKLPSNYAEACIKHMDIELASCDKTNYAYIKYVSGSVSRTIYANNAICNCTPYFAIINAEHAAYYARDAIAYASSYTAFGADKNEAAHIDACIIYNTALFNASKQQADILRSLVTNPFNT